MARVRPTGLTTVLVIQMTTSVPDQTKRLTRGGWSTWVSRRLSASSSWPTYEMLMVWNWAILFFIGLHWKTGEINYPEPFSKICANRLPVFIISFLPLATLLQFLGYVLAHHFLAQLHEQKSFNHLWTLPSVNINHLSNSVYTSNIVVFIMHCYCMLLLHAFFAFCTFIMYPAIRLSSRKCAINSQCSVLQW